MKLLRFFLLLLYSLHCSAGTLRHFNETPYLLECSGSKEESYQLKCFDPDDLEFDCENVPFLLMETHDEAEIVELGRTANFSGKMIVSLALELQKEFRAACTSLTDTACSLPCERDGKWCCDEALMDLRMTSVFIKGKSYYEALGAFPEDPSFSQAAQFIHELPLNSFMHELSSLPQTKSMIQMIQDICIALEISPNSSTMGELAKNLYHASKKNEYAHKLWHRFHDSFIAEKENLFVSYLVQSQHPHPDLLSFFKSEMSLLLEQGVDLDSDFTEFYLIKHFEKMSAFSNSPALFLQSRASDTCHRNTIYVNSLIKNHPKLSSLLSLKATPRNESSLIEQWFLAKQQIRQTKRFTFLK